MSILDLSCFVPYIQWTVKKRLSVMENRFLFFFYFIACFRCWRVADVGGHDGGENVSSVRL